MGDLLGQADLMFTRKEEADRPQAGVVGRATLWVIVYLMGAGRYSEGSLQQLPQAGLSFTPPIWGDLGPLCAEHFSPMALPTVPLQHCNRGKALAACISRLSEKEIWNEGHMHTKLGNKEDGILTQI